MLIPESIRDKVNNIQEFNDTAITHKIPLDVKLAYRNVQDYDDVWHLMAQDSIDKKFSCFRSPYSLDCDMIQLFELPTVHHDYYLVNLKLGESEILHSIKDESGEAVKNLYFSKELPEVRIALTVSFNDLF